jgi:uncharacterized protein
MSVGIAVIVVVAGFGVGFLAGLFGVGGGLLMVPFLVLVLDTTQHVAEGTSLAVIVPTALAGAVVHVRHKNVELKIAALMGLGGIAGAIGGATLALNLNADVLRRGFSVVVALMGIRYIVQGLKLARAERGEA